MIRLITGGQRSGKSMFAEKLFADFSDVVYFATAEKREDDYEMQARIQKHIAHRNQKWRTVECYKSFDTYISTEKHYLLDCITNSVSRFLFEYTGEKSNITDDDFKAVFAAIQKTFSTLLTVVRDKDLDLLMVTNEVGSATIPMHKITRMFVDLQGMTNSFLAAHCDEVYWCVSGIPVRVK